MVTADGNEPVVAEGIAVTVEKEIFNGAPAVAEVTKIRVGGRKMILKRALGEEIVKEESVDEESQKITGANHSVGIGNDANALKKLLGTSQEHMNNQNDRILLKAKSMKSASLETSGKRPVDLPNTKPLCSQDSKLISSRDSSKCSSRSKKSAPQKSDHDLFQNLESQKLLEAANEIVNLMSKDYQGHQSTPPINNDEPLYQEHVKP
ncbi:hypothetical protein L1049_028053 [Liquidambar formosana]|uniref:Uncharacterized protein n=1 Tax=Liquidambar formosana TaxID=63359 RepID=A0AAP0RIC7_LIQFO